MKYRSKYIAELYSRYYEELMVFGANYTYGNQNIQDAIQTVFQKLLLKKDNLPTESKLKTYLYQSVKNEILCDIRREKMIKEHQDLNRKEYGLPIEEQIIHTEMEHKILSAISKLPPRCQDVINLSIKDVRREDIAIALGVSEETVKTQKKIAKAKLKDILNMCFLYFF